jgi:hypothetical protein
MDAYATWYLEEAGRQNAWNPGQKMSAWQHANVY